MASSAFKSTTRRTLHASDDRKAPPSRRSRSVSAAPRRGGGDLEEYANTRTNPLFNCASSSSPPPPPAGCGCGEVARRGRGREAKGGGQGGGGGRARSASVAPPRRCSTSSASTDSGGGGRRVSRARSVAGETDHENRDGIRNLQSWRSRHPTSSTSEASSGGKHWGDGVFTGSSSEVSTMKVGLQETNGNSHSESTSAFSEIEDDLEHAIWRNNHSTIPAKQVLEIPPEFDLEATEFVSGISGYSTKLKQDQIVEIPREFDPDASELVSDIRQHTTKFLQGEIEFLLGLDPDADELVDDIREYTTKLKQSHERAQKLRADLAVEEQREQELSRLLKNIVTTNFSETHKKQPRRKRSIERLKVSRCLAEEAMNYFEECVSISTLDSADFSSFEDPQPNSVVSVQPMSNSRFPKKGESTFTEHHFPTDRLGHHEGLDNQTQCSISITGSDVSDSVFFGRTKVPDFIIGHNSGDDLDGFDTPCSGNSHFSFAHGPAKTLKIHDGRQYSRCSGRGISKEPREIRSSSCDDEYVFQNFSESLLTDMVTFRNRIESGGLLICNIRTF